jgi:hypothetical protein
MVVTGFHASFENIKLAFPRLAFPRQLREYMQKRLYSLRGPLLHGRFGRAAGSAGSNNAPVSLALSSDEGSSTSRMKAVASNYYECVPVTEIGDSNTAVAHCPSAQRLDD